MMKHTAQIITPEDIHNLKKEFEVFTFSSDTEIFNEEHIPLTGIILLDGTLEIFQGNMIIEKVNPPHMEGIVNLVNDLPSNYGCRIKANSKVILIGKSKILDILKNKRSHLFNLLKASVTNETRSKIKA